MKRLSAHWPEYVIEAICLALFMISAAGVATLLKLVLLRDPDGHAMRLVSQ